MSDLLKARDWTRVASSGQPLQVSSSPRPRSLLALLTQLLRLRGRSLARGALGAVVIVLALGLFAIQACPSPEVKIATFNIRDFPEHPRQIEGAFQTIAALDVPVVAVQEITSPTTFAAAAKHYLGWQWRAEFGLREPVKGSGLVPKGPVLLPGVLYDGDEYELDYARRRFETRIGDVGRPTLEVRLRHRERSPRLRVFVVHLKSGGDHFGLRRKQLEALAPRVRAAAKTNDEVVVLGDFNATGEQDRVALAEFALVTGLHWASAELECTAYWRPGGKCTGSALDHVFTERAPASVAARGPCEEIGCEPGDSCPIFHDVVSDHCPVSAAF
jgi:endonuclease/exonuclease/phosphatase family metal-dependent hydrolase